MIYKCSIDSYLFNFWLEHQLLLNIHKKSLIVMDNAGFYTSEKTKELVGFFCMLLFLPHYLHDSNHIEHFFGFHEGEN